MEKIKDKAMYLERVFTYYDAEAIIPITQEAINVKDYQIQQLKEELDRLHKILNRAKDTMKRVDLS